MTVLVIGLVVLAVLIWPLATGRSGLGRPVSLPAVGASRAPRCGPLGGHLPKATPRPGPADVEDVADALVLVALSLRAGLPVVAALEQAGCASPPPVAADLTAVAAALRWGRSTTAAWGHAHPVWRAAWLAFRMADSTGAGPADLLDAAATRLREEHERDRERRAARAGVLLVLPLGLGFLPAFACTAVVPLVVVLADGVLGAS